MSILDHEPLRLHEEAKKLLNLDTATVNIDSLENPYLGKVQSTEQLEIRTKEAIRHTNHPSTTLPFQNVNGLPNSFIR